MRTCINEFDAPFYHPDHSTKPLNPDRKFGRNHVDALIGRRQWCTFVECRIPPQRPRWPNTRASNACERRGCISVPGVYLLKAKAKFEAILQILVGPWNVLIRIEQTLPMMTTRQAALIDLNGVHVGLPCRAKSLTGGSAH